MLVNGVGAVLCFGETTSLLPCSASSNSKCTVKIVSENDEW